MEKRITVLYRHGLAQYDIEEIADGHFIARLFRFNGVQIEQPPLEIEIHKEGRHWQDGNTSQDLFDDIGLAIEDSKKEAGLRGEKQSKLDAD